MTHDPTFGRATFAGYATDNDLVPRLARIAEKTGDPKVAALARMYDGESFSDLTARQQRAVQADYDTNAARYALREALGAISAGFPTVPGKLSIVLYKRDRTADYPTVSAYITRDGRAVGTVDVVAEVDDRDEAADHTVWKVPESDAAFSLQAMMELNATDRAEVRRLVDDVEIPWMLWTEGEESAPVFPCQDCGRPYRRFLGREIRCASCEEAAED